MRRSSWSRSSHMVRAPAAVRQNRRLSRCSRPSPSRRQSHREPGRGTVSACRWHMSLTGCRSSVGGCRAGRRTGRGGRPWDSRGGASGLLRPRLGGRTAMRSVCCSAAALLLLAGVVIRGTYAEVRFAIVLRLVRRVVRHGAAIRGWHVVGGGKGEVVRWGGVGDKQ
jgi:hypothetical protein